jgi:hypothetical protein
MPRTELRQSAVSSLNRWLFHRYPNPTTKLRALDHGLCAGLVFRTSGRSKTALWGWDLAPPSPATVAALVHTTDLLLPASPGGIWRVQAARSCGAARGGRGCVACMTITHCPWVLRQTPRVTVQLSRRLMREIADRGFLCRRRRWRFYAQAARAVDMGSRRASAGSRTDPVRDPWRGGCAGTSGISLGGQAPHGRVPMFRGRSACAAEICGLRPVPGEGGRIVHGPGASDAVGTRPITTQCARPPGPGHTKRPPAS